MFSVFESVEGNEIDPIIIVRMVVHFYFSLWLLLLRKYFTVAVLFVSLTMSIDRKDN